ncbi:Peroxidase like protein [Argiope bruennichi]|uniref:Peroxidase like protein n=1 Tax=Argiope bruennichi TaxID=94029 RepID=A0A8T0EEH6_ARGBR|nr:Peroxidase like protein [Argiope bruennichi]
MSSSYLTYLVFIPILGLVVPSESFQALLQNPGQGVNFYGKAQSNPPPSESKAKKAYNDLMQPDSISCCSEENADNPLCIPIKLKPDDPFYSKFNKTCINLQRTLECSCKSSRRAQPNEASAHLDESQLYGNSKEGAMKARALDGTGQLKYEATSVGCLLPRGKNPDDPFCPVGYDSVCFKGADPRINHHTIVMSHFTIFLREHNRLATELKKINPHWGEEKLFQETRKILNAEHQCMFFKDFLPILLTPRIMDAFDLTVPEGENGIEYNSSVIPGTWNEFAISSFRLHSMVRREIGSLNLRFKQTFLNPLLIREGHMTEIISGIRQIPAEQYDRYMIQDFTDFLYEQPGVPYGKDLASFNIKRGRDHGLAPYVEVVKFCSEGTVLISSFNDLYKLGLMSKSNANLLKRVYAAVEDIDMWVGMNLEEHMPGSPLGPSAVCINAKQFYFMQKGDRFYFDIVGPEAPFTSEQRKAIKQSSWARILCDNTHISQVTKNPFLLPSDDNTNVPCSEIPKIDLTLWKDEGNDTIRSPQY